MNEESVITEIKGIGEKNAKLYEKAGIKTVGELLRHYPKGYERFEEIKPIAGLVKGEKAAVYGSIYGPVNLKKIRNLTILTLYLRDQTGTLQLTFFNMPFLQKLR